MRDTKLNFGRYRGGDGGGGGALHAKRGESWDQIVCKIAYDTNERRHYCHMPLWGRNPIFISFIS